MSERSAPLVLIVDDDEVKRYSISRIIRRAGFEIEEAGTGTAALELAAHDPDLIVLDVNLPDISGLEVCRRLKADPQTASIPVLQLSAVAIQTVDRVEGLNSGADGYLAEPVEATELVATVQSLLRIRQAEERAREAASQWQATFDAISDGLCLVDAEGMVLRCNAALAARLGQPVEALERLPLADLARRENLPPVEEAFGRLAVTGAPQRWEAESGQGWFRLNLDPVRGPDGRLAGAVYILSDITEQKRLQAELQAQNEQIQIQAEELHVQAEELQEQNRAIHTQNQELEAQDRHRNEFLAMLAHELRNPLAPILTSVEVLRALEAENTPIARHREIIARQIRHLTRLVDDLLDVARITQGKITLQKEPADLRSVVEQAVQISQPLITEREQEIRVSLPTERVPVFADQTRLTQVVCNLLNNASKYTDPRGRIELTLERSGPEAVLQVTDTGRGIPPDVLPRVFDLFVQEEGAGRSPEGGLGVGLTLVRSLVRQHDGTVAASSEGIGQGSTFEVRLPVSDLGLTPGGDGEAGDRRSQVAGPASRRVLVIDDNVDAAETLAELIALWGHDTQVAFNGGEGIEAAREFRPEVVLLDISMPDLDGYEVAARLRTQDPQVKLVALTGFGSQESQRRSEEAGFDVHLTKPVSEESVRALFTA